MPDVQAGQLGRAEQVGVPQHLLANGRACRFAPPCAARWATCGPYRTITSALPASTA